MYSDPCRAQEPFTTVDTEGNPEVSPLTPPASSAVKHSSKPLFLRILAGLASVLLFLVALGRAGLLPSLPTISLPLPYHPPDGWIRYTDPLGAFTVWMPHNWTSLQIIETERIFNENQNSYTTSVEAITLGGEGTDLSDIASYRLDLTVTPIPTSDALAYWCHRDLPPPNATIAGLPAIRYDVLRYGGPDKIPAGWVILSRAAVFGIIPSATVLEANDATTEQIVGGFQPAAREPLTCPAG